MLLGGSKNYPKKFITANQEDKGKILSEILELKRLDRARKIAQDRIRLLKPEKIEVSGKVNKYEALRANEEESLREYTKLAEEFNLVKKEKIHRLKDSLDLVLEELSDADSALTKSIQSIEDIINTIDSKESELDDLNKIKKLLQEKEYALSNKIKEASSRNLKLETLTKRITSKKRNIEENKVELKKYKKIIDNPEKESCPLCGSAFKVDHLDEVVALVHKIIGQNKLLKSELEDLNNEFSEISQVDVSKSKEILYGVNNKIKDVDIKINYIKSLDQDLISLNYDKNKHENTIKHLKNTITAKKELINEEMSTKPTNILENIKSTKRKIKDLNVKIKEHQQNYDNIVETLGKLETLKEGFREVKAHIFTRSLKELSRKANNYIAELFEVPMKIIFENVDMKINTNVEIFDKSRPLGLYSGGQFRRLALATDLAVADLVKSRKNCLLNLLALDEPCKDLSENSMQKVLSLLSNRREPVLIIEHNSLIKSIIDNTFEIEYKNGVSKNAT